MKPTKHRKQAMLALAAVTENNKQAEREIKSYIERLEVALNQAFDLLAADNMYSQNSNKAWQILGEALDKIHSEQSPFNDDSVQ